MFILNDKKADERNIVKTGEKYAFEKTKLLFKDLVAKMRQMIWVK